jgi:CubicO group peptidase (beta-lactamase class C family)
MISQVAGQRGLGGVGVAVVRRGADPTFACEGLADGATARPIEPATVFRIASITKTMTAIGVLQLRDQGRLELDDPVNDYLQGLRIATPTGGPAITFRHLLTHTAGIGEMPRVLHFFRRASWGAGEPASPALDLPTLYGGTLRTEVPAGTKWAYANHAFVVLGKLIEDVTGRSLPDYMDDRLFAPLGMTHTAYGRSGRTAPQLARGHHWMLGRFREVRDYDLTLLGAGAVLSSLSDMARYASWLLDGGSDEVLKPSTLQEMTRAQFAIAPGLPAIGLAFSLSQYGEHAVFGHDGNMPDFASVLLVAPEAGVGVVVLTNTATVLGANQLAAAILRQELGEPDPVASLTAAAIMDPPQRWARLTGSYAPTPGFLTNVRPWQMLGGEVQVVVRHRRLVLRALSPVRTLRRGATLYRTNPADPSRYAFVHDGQVVPVVFDDAPTERNDRLVIGRPVNAALFRRPALRSSGLRLRIVAAVALALLVRRVWRGRSA